jgi:hypothetical protein
LEYSSPSDSFEQISKKSIEGEEFRQIETDLPIQEFELTGERRISADIDSNDHK